MYADTHFWLYVRGKNNLNVHQAVHIAHQAIYVNIALAVNPATYIAPFCFNSFQKGFLWGFFLKHFQ